MTLLLVLLYVHRHKCRGKVRNLLDIHTFLLGYLSPHSEDYLWEHRVLSPYRQSGIFKQSVDLESFPPLSEDNLWEGCVVHSGIKLREIGKFC